MRHRKIHEDLVVISTIKQVYELISSHLNNPEIWIPQTKKQENLLQNINNIIVALPFEKPQAGQSEDTIKVGQIHQMISTAIQKMKNKNNDEENVLVKYLTHCLFHLAIEHHHLELVKLVFELDKDIIHSLNPLLPYHYSPLHTLCLNQQQNKELAQFLLWTGAWLNVFENVNKQSPIAFATARNQEAYANLFSKYALSYCPEMFKKKDAISQSAELKPNVVMKL